MRTMERLNLTKMISNESFDMPIVMDREDGKISLRLFLTQMFGILKNGIAVARFKMGL